MGEKLTQADLIPILPRVNQDPLVSRQHHDRVSLLFGIAGAATSVGAGLIAKADVKDIVISAAVSATASFIVRRVTGPLIDNSRKKRQANHR